jgi:hypothetical protein
VDGDPATVDGGPGNAWDKPVTLDVRLVSVVSDDLKHVGQAAFVRGIARR